jgi:hypothetical protein
MFEMLCLAALLGEMTKNPLPKDLLIHIRHIHYIVDAPVKTGGE